MQLLNFQNLETCIIALGDNHIVHTKLPLKILKL